MNCIEAGQIKSDPNRFWSGLQRCQRDIKIAGPISQPIIIPIECDQRRNHDIRTNDFSIARHWNVIRTQIHLHAGCPLQELERSATTDDGRKRRHPTLNLQALHHRTQIHFGFERPVAAQRLRRKSSENFLQSIDDDSAGTLMFF